MKSINRIIIKGRTGKDPETTKTASGKTKCTFSVATDESWKDANGEWKKNTEWHNVVIWNEKLAANVGQYVKKGDVVLVEGKSKTRAYDDKSGVKQRITEVVADDVDLIQAWPKAETPQGEPPTDLPF